jgi:hypothetical protein
MVSAFSSFSPEEAGLCASSGKSWHVSEEGQLVFCVREGPGVFEVHVCKCCRSSLVRVISESVGEYRGGKKNSRQRNQTSSSKIQRRDLYGYRISWNLLHGCQHHQSVNLSIT